MPQITLPTNAPLSAAVASTPPGTIGMGGLTVGGATIRVAAQMYLIPVVIPEAVTATKLTAEVTIGGGTGSVVRLGIYASEAHGFPGALVLDAGTIDGTSATAQSITISQRLSPGLYWLAASSQGAPAGEPTMRTASGASPYVFPTAWPANVATTAYVQTSVTGALPNPAVPTGTANNGTRVGITV